MIDFKKEIAKMIKEQVDMSIEELMSYIEVPKDQTMGDFAFPCFRLAKELKKAPPIIANDIKENINIDINVIEKLEVAGGYLNFYTNKTTLVKGVLEKIDSKGDKYGFSNIGEGKTVLIEYSSPNIAKPMHMGHLRNTILGGALYKIFKSVGYNVVGANFIGDWGINFAKMMAGYFMWKEDKQYDFENDALNSIVNIYVRFNKEEKENPEYMEMARSWHLKLEAGDKEAVELWEWIKDISLKEAEKIYKLLDCEFDNYNGEACYAYKINEIIEELKEKKLLVESQGAQVVDLSKYDMPPSIIMTSSGTSLYATRDLACLEDRMNSYDFDQALYIVGSEQQLYFNQLFKVFELMGYEKYAKKCKHIFYGLILDSSGKKMGTRQGNSLTLTELLNEGITKSRNIIEEKQINIDNKDELVKQIGIGAIIFNTLFNTKIKDITFDWDNILNFAGETGPYIQYTFVRINSILNKVDQEIRIEDVKFELYKEKETIKLIKLLDEFEDMIISAAEKYEPSIVSRYLIDLSQSFSSFYNECQIISEDIDLRNARIYLTSIVGQILKRGANLLGIKMPEKM